MVSYIFSLTLHIKLGAGGGGGGGGGDLMGYTFFDASMVGSTLQPTMLLNVLLLLLPKILGFMFCVNKHIFLLPILVIFVPMDQYYVLHGWGLHFN